MADPVIVRDYRPADWPDLCRIHDLARPVELEGSCDPRAFLPLADDPEAADLPEYRLVVASRHGRSVGFAGTREDYIGWLYVDPDHFGRGIGRRLLRVAVEQAGPAAWTICLAGNQRALTLYTRAGFEPVHEFSGDNAGYPCTCVRLALSAPL